MFLLGIQIFQCSIVVSYNRKTYGKSTTIQCWKYYNVNLETKGIVRNEAYKKLLDLEAV